MRLTDRVYLDWNVALGKGDISPHRNDMFTSSDLPHDVTIQPDISEAMKMYCSAHDFPEHLRTLHCVKRLSKTRLFQSFCCGNRNTEVIEHNNQISVFVQAFYKNSDVFTCIAQEEICKASVDHVSSILATPQTMAADTSHNISYHELHLFRGCKVMLMRNILVSRGFANGNQFIVLNCGRHFVESMNITQGEFFGQVEYLFRIRVKITLKSQFSSNFRFVFLLQIRPTNSKEILCLRKQNSSLMYASHLFVMAKHLSCLPEPNVEIRSSL
jgi:PIF1-like helicase